MLSIPLDFEYGNEGEVPIQFYHIFIQHVNCILQSELMQFVLFQRNDRQIFGVIILQLHVEKNSIKGFLQF